MSNPNGQAVNGNAASNPAVLTANEAVKSTPSVTAEQQRIAVLEARLKRYEQDLIAKRKPLQFKVGEKGGVQINGMGRFPFTPYASQLKRILQAADDLKAFMSKHIDELNFQNEAERDEVESWLTSK